MKLLTCPNLVGLRSYSPDTTYPPPPGSRGSKGAVMLYSCQSEFNAARLSVTVNPRYQRRVYATSTDERAVICCWTDAPTVQSDDLTPQPVRRAGSKELVNVGVPKA